MYLNYTVFLLYIGFIINAPVNEINMAAKYIIKHTFLPT